MAIKIPSKNIYEINNPKIMDNLVDNVSVEQTIVKPNNKYEVSVYNGKAKNFYNGNEQNDIETDIAQIAYPTNNGAISYTSVVPIYSTVEINIPVLGENYWVQSLLLGLDKNEATNIKYTIYGTVKKGNATATVTQSGDDYEQVEFVSTPKLSEPTEIISDQSYILPPNKIDNEITYGGSAALAKANAVITIDDKSNLGQIKQPPISIIDNLEYYSINAIFLCGMKIIKLGNRSLFTWQSGTTYTKEMSGTYEEYIPTQIEITIYGNTIGIDLTDGSVTYGSGNKPFSLSGNELLQDSGRDVSEKIEVWVRIFSNSATTDGWLCNVAITPVDIKLSPNDILYYTGSYGETKKAIVVKEITLESSNNGYQIFMEDKGSTSMTAYWAKKKPIAERLANNVLAQYAKGKETATLLCDIADYYNENDEKVIDIKTNKMSFRLHDEVIPYVFGANGQDQPMSKYQDGAEKVFEVVGSNMIYDGAVWQELTLQEKAQNT